MAFQNCHNCGSLWSPGSEEYDWQQCSSCGWTPGDPIEENEVDPDNVDDFDEDEKYMRKEIEKSLDVNKSVKGQILITTPLDIDLNFPPQLEKLLNDIQEAKKYCENNVGIPESRQGFVKHFQPNYPLPDKFGNEIKPIK